MIAAERWRTKEAIGLGTDPETGARITQLTSAPLINANIYGEVPFMDPESRFMMFIRSRDSHGPVEVWRAEMEKFNLNWVCDGVLRRRCMGMSHAQRSFNATRVTP